MGAGFLPFTIHRKQVYFLFSRECKKTSKNKWSDFGGSKEKNETVIETASREGFEETDGLFGNQDDVRELIETNTKKIIYLGSDYTTYLVYIPYDNMLPKDFRSKFINVKKTHPELICKNGYYEKDMLKWINYNKLSTFIKDVRSWYKFVIYQIMNIDKDEFMNY